MFNSYYAEVLCDSCAARKRRTLRLDPVSYRVSDYRQLKRVAD